MVTVLNSSEVFESILIDEFNNCLSLALNSYQSCTVDLFDSRCTVEMNAVPTEKWHAEMNVRAIYSEDGKLYEAVIKELVDDNKALVRFQGYDNEEIVNVNSLLPSLGTNAIEKQIELSLSDKILDNEEQTEDDESIWKEINWKIGMDCRALYEKNDTIYEATIIKINNSDRTALVEMIGYGILFEAKFEDLYESIPEYRLKQEISAQNYINKQGQSSKEALQSRLEKNPSNSTDFETKVKVTPSLLKEEQLTNSLNDSTHGLLKNHLVRPLPTEGILQPENESEALACLISANYLSGYYAGYYECIRKQHNPH